MGFTLTSLGILILAIIIAIYNNWYLSEFYHIIELYECIAGYGLGGSTMALFGRVGGGIYTKAADVGADLVGKVEEDLDEDSPYNPATIADNVGDNVGDIAGMGSDLFGSFAEATCAALVVASSSPTFYYNPAALYYPL
jgi:H+-translocating diphosphatase